MEQSKKTSFDFYMLPLVLAVAVVPLLTMMTAAVHLLIFFLALSGEH